MAGEGRTDSSGAPGDRPLPARPSCPSCGSKHTQPFTHAGPGARVNMQCTDCRHLFKDKDLRR
jgi:rubredoxin